MSVTIAVRPIAIRHDHRGRFGPARDQGVRPTCLAFAMSDVHAAAIGPWIPLCCEYLFFHAKRRGNACPHSGATVPAIRDALELDGQPVEDAWPYLKSVPADPKKWQPPAEPGELFRRKSDLLGRGFDEVWESLADGKPAIVGMTVSDAFYSPSEAGVVDSDEDVDPSRRHAVVAVASGVRARKKYLMVRNSWGDSWGLSGYAWIAERYMDPRIQAIVTLN